MLILIKECLNVQLPMYALPRNTMMGKSTYVNWPVLYLGKTITAIKQDSIGILYLTDFLIYYCSCFIKQVGSQESQVIRVSNKCENNQLSKGWVVTTGYFMYKRNVQRVIVCLLQARERDILRLKCPQQIKSISQNAARIFLASFH